MKLLEIFLKLTKRYEHAMNADSKMVIKSTVVVICLLFDLRRVTCRELPCPQILIALVCECCN